MSMNERDLVQRRAALQKGTDVRVKRAALKLDLKTGRASIIRLLERPPGYIETMKLFDLILAVPTYGKSKTYKLLADCRIPSLKTVGGLTERQSRTVVALLSS